MSDEEPTTDSSHRTLNGRIDTMRPNRPRPSSGDRATASQGVRTNGANDLRGDGGRARADAAETARSRGREDDESAEEDTASETPEPSDGDDEESDAEGASPEADAGSEADREDERTNALAVELDPFVRALATRRAEADGDSLDEYVVDAVKGYLASMLGGKVSSTDLVGSEHALEVDADPVLDALLTDVAGEGSVEETLIRAFAEQHDIPLETQEVSVAGLRAHEALLNGVVANASNDLDSQSAVVQAALEARLGVADDTEE